MIEILIDIVWKGFFWLSVIGIVQGLFLALIFVTLVEGLGGE